jgi:hypothetical protein
VFEWQLDQVARGFDGGVLAEDVGVSRGRYGSLRGLRAGRSVAHASPSEIESETDTDTAMVAVGGGGEVGWRNLAVWPKPRRLAFEVIDQGPSGVIGDQGVWETVDGGSDGAWVEERAQADATVAVVGDLGIRSGRCGGPPQVVILCFEGQVGDGHEQNDVSQKAEPGLAGAGCPWDLEATARNAEAPQQRLRKRHNEHEPQPDQQQIEVARPPREKQTGGNHYFHGWEPQGKSAHDRRRQELLI